MEYDGPARARSPRFVFQVQSDGDRTVIRVLDTRTDTVFREIPVDVFLEHARRSKDLRALLFGN